MGLPWLRKKSELVWGVVKSPSQSQLVMVMHQRGAACVQFWPAIWRHSIVRSPVSYMFAAARDQVRRVYTHWEARTRILRWGMERPSNGPIHSYTLRKLALPGSNREGLIYVLQLTLKWIVKQGKWAAASEKNYKSPRKQLGRTDNWPKKN